VQKRKPFCHQIKKTYNLNMKKQKTLSIAASIAASLSITAAYGATVAGWSFENNAIGVNNSPTASTGTGTASSIGMDIYPTSNVGVTTDDVVLGKASDTGANGVADTTQTWRVRAQAGANGAANGWSSLAPIGTQGAVFAASTVGFNNINVSFDWYATTQGEANMQLEYTTDGINWNNVALTLGGSDAGLVVLNNTTSVNTVMGSYVSDNLLLNGSPAGQGWFTDLTATITDPNAANDPKFAIEMVNASTGADNVGTPGTPLNNNSGNWRFDNVSISGVSAAPEPSTFALAGCGLALFAGLRRFKNRQS
jgi:hypothetical protein